MKARRRLFILIFASQIVDAQRNLSSKLRYDLEKSDKKRSIGQNLENITDLIGLDAPKVITVVQFRQCSELFLLPDANRYNKSRRRSFRIQ